jgi:stage II sporulation protein D
MSQRLFLGFLGLLISVNLFAVSLDISIFHNFPKTELSFTSLSGRYYLIHANDTLARLTKGEELKIIKVADTAFQVFRSGKSLGTYGQINLNGKGFIKAFSVNIAPGPTAPRTFDDNLLVRMFRGKLQLINRVDLEHYTAGVVQSEALGSSKDLQFFLVQAISCRTYALVNYLKHADEHFNLCDDVHCQYYTGRCRNADISRAVARTSGDVIVDENDRMISAAFHSNCGGQTVNSEDVWSIPTSYLKSVRNTFCLHQSNATWRYAMAKDDWLKFLKEHYGYPIDHPKMRIRAYTFQQPERKIYFEDGIPLKDIRRDLHLRSTFFSLESKKDSVVFHGRGYGHGVGLCQQGAIHMADLGIDYRKIIEYYYRGTHIIHYSELRYDFMP